MPKKKSVVLPTSKKIRSDDIEVIEDNLSEVVEEVEGELTDVCIERSSLIRAVVLAVFSGNHLLIEGDPGTAKSFVVRKFFEHLDPKFGTFKILLTKDTIADALVGPVNLNLLREEGRFEYNTTGMLPEAHFAMLEEVYRARGTVLDNMLTILNERVFPNAGEEIACPLNTAFGTTNFIGTDSEGEAFLDRWTIHYRVYPLSPGNRKALFCIPNREVDGLRKITPAHLAQAKTKIKAVRVTHEVLSAYLELIGMMENNNLFTRKLTDRRIQAAFELVKTEAVLTGEDAVRLEHLYAARYGLTLAGDPAQDNEFDKIYEAIIQKYRNSLAEDEDIESLRLDAEKFMEIASKQVAIGKNGEDGKPREKYIKTYRVGCDIVALLSAAPDFKFTASATYLTKRNALLDEVKKVVSSFDVT